MISIVEEDLLLEVELSPFLTSGLNFRKPLKSAVCHQEEARFPEDLFHCWEDEVAHCQCTSESHLRGEKVL